MRTTFAASAALLSALQLVAGQTFTDCDPTKKSCPAEPALGTTLTTDFTKGADSVWEPAAGTTLSYDATNGAAFTISKVGQAPTIGLHKYIMFGKVEVVLKAAPGSGIVSSFVLESGDLDEIDWEWVGSDHGNVQTNFFGKGNTTTYDRGQFHAIPDPTAAFHTYTIDWTAESLRWYVDGNLVRTLAYGDALALGGKNYPQTPMQVKLGSWIGCASQAAAADDKTKWTCQWAGGAADFSAGPSTMYVKSVKIQDYGCASEYSYGDMSGSWQSIVATGGCKGGSAGGSSSSSSSSKTSSSSSSNSSSAAAILIETSVSTNGSSSSSSSGSSSSTRAPTLTTTSSASATTSPVQSSPNAGSTLLPKKKYGVLDAAVLVLGLGMGYLVM